METNTPIEYSTEPIDVPYGYCHCGCGKKTAISNKTDTYSGAVKGEPRKYYRSHAPRKHPEVRFMKHVNKIDGGCWEWTGHINNKGYGKFALRPATPVYAHRFSYVMHKGAIPQGLVVMHKCDNPKCVNPDHLSVGTYKDNSQDCVRKDRMPKDIQPKGTDQYLAKLDPTKVRLIRQLSSSCTYVDLAKRFAVDPSVVRRAAIGQSWKHVK